MKNTKYQNFSAGRAGNGRVNLAAGRLEFAHEDTKSDADILPISISHVYSSERAINGADATYGKGFKLNLQQKLTHREGDDTKWKYIDGNGEEHKFKERYYYLNADNKKQFLQGIKSSDVEIKQSGRLFCALDPNQPENKTEVFAEIKTKSGLSLQTDLKNYKGKDIFDTRHEELAKIEEEIKSLNRNIEDLNYSLLESKELDNKLDPDSDDGYASMYAKFQEIEILSRNLEKQMILDFKGKLDHLSSMEMNKINNIKNSISSCLPENIHILYDILESQFNNMTLLEKQEYLIAVKQKYQGLIKKSILSVNTVSPTSLTESTWQTFSQTSLGSLSRFTYSDIDGKMVDALSTEIEFGNAQVAHLDNVHNPHSNLTDAERKLHALQIFKQKFSDKCDKVRQKLDEFSTAIEKSSWENQKVQMQQRADLIKKQEKYLKIKELLESERYVQTIERVKDDIETANNMLQYKQYIHEQLITKLPVNYVISQDGLALGFNKAGDLVAIFDNYDNQTAIIHENGKIAKVIESNEKEIVFEYSKANGNIDKLISITDSLDRKTEFKYNADKPDLLELIIYPNGDETTFKYDSDSLLNVDLLSEILPPSLIGTKVEYFNGKVSSLCDISYAESINSEGLVESLSYETDNAINIVYSLNNTQVLNPKTGEKAVYYFSGEKELLAECYLLSETPEKIVLFDAEADNYSLVFEKTEFEKGEFNEYPDIGAVVANFQAGSGSRALSDAETLAGNWVYSEFDGEENKTAEYSNEKTSDKIVNGVKTGEFKTKIHKEFKYDNKNNLIEETQFEVKTEIDNNSAPVITAKEITTKYEYNKQGKLIRATDNNGMVSEIVYDKKGNRIKQIFYHKSNPSEKFYSEKEVSEKGQVLSEFDERGENKTSYGYIEDTNIVKSLTAPDGQTTNFGLDPYTDEVTALTSIAGGENNSTVYGYTKGFLTSLKSGNTEFKYEYNGFGLKTAIYMNDEPYVSYAYPDGDGSLGRITIAEYTTGETFKTVADKFGKVLTVKKIVNNTEQPYLEYVYDDKDRLIQTLDYAANKSTVTAYSENGGVLSVSDGEITTTAENDVNGNLTKVKYAFENTEQVYSYEYDKEGKLNKVIFPNNDEANCKYDKLGRITGLNNPVVKEEIYYHQCGGHATNLVSSIYQKVGDRTERQKYTYDSKGNIIQVNENGRVVIRYRYDGLNRLIREDNAKLNKSYTFEYDNNGNILYKGEYDFSIRDLTSGKVLEYTYDNDKLVILNGGEGFQGFEYDGLGNPKVYKDKNLNWNNLRNLVSYDGVNFGYDASGLRTKKTANGVETKFYYADNRLLAEKRFISTGELCVGGYLYEGGVYYTYTDKTDISYMYNANGLTSFTIDRLGTQQTYYYRKNLQGDITHIYDAGGVLKAEYIYDAWGNFEIAVNEDNIANINPFRYRGYYFDAEIGLYYLKSRYYDSEVGRFLSPDDISIIDESQGMINGLNLYSYCGSNPVMRTDPSGQAWWHWLVGLLVIAVLAVAVVATAGIAGVGIGAAFGAGFAGTAIGAGASGLAVTIAAGAFAGAVIGAVSGAVIGGLIGGTVSAIGGGSFWGGFLDGAASGFMMGAITGAFTGGLRGAIAFKNSTPIFRAVNSGEVKNGQFLLKQGAFEGKQFGLKLTETRNFANLPFNNGMYNSIVSTRIPNSVLAQFTKTMTDTFVFKSGIITIASNQINLLNSVIKYIMFLPL